MGFTEVLGDFLGMLCGVVAIGIFIPAYDVTSSHPYVGVADETIENVLAT